MATKDMSKNPGKRKLCNEDFINHEEVKKCMAQLNAAFGPESGRSLVVSDLLDAEGNQYVNLVQKGGGVLGVALVGYTYMLEYMRIRFLRLAGTSAGAINTALMTVIDKKQDAKSPKILTAICELDFFSLVDGHPVARMLIKKFITNKNFSGRIKRWLTWIILMAVLFVAADIIFLGLQNKFSYLSNITQLLFILTGFYFLLLFYAIFFITKLLQRLKNSGFGINPGNTFYTWIKDRLLENGVVTVSDLNTKAAAIPAFHLRVEHPQGVDDLKGDVTFIASELVTQNKIQFPEMCNLFRPANEINSLQPAGFIRASMSIPVFFESYLIKDIPIDNEAVRKQWLETMNEPNPPTVVRFVDGGILSNFPINIFYNPKIVTPRLPSFGIDLDDSSPASKSNNPFSWSLAGYVGRMFNTIRFYYDKDFLLKNKTYEKGIGKIPLAGYNWLNFFLTDEDKINMFVKGAQAATEFLLEFNWDDYKNEREKMQVLLNRGQEPAGK